MASQQLNLGLKQSMNLTLALRQSINMLQMPSDELAAFLNTELDKNPFLESIEHTDNSEERYDYLVTHGSDEDYNPFDAISREKSLSEHILEQIGFVISDPIERWIAFFLTHMLSESGYINLNIEIAQRELKCSEEKILSVLNKLQSLEPTGVFARNLEECLTLQLKEKGLYNNIFETILANLQLIANHDLEKLAKICKLPLGELVTHIKTIKKLNPKPGSEFGAENISSKIPDVILTIDEENNITVRLNKKALPTLTVSKSYYSEVKTNLTKGTDKEFISQEYYSANSLIRAVAQRSKTILAIATKIAELQKDFFIKGVMYLKPMTLAMVAAECGLNESTVSRATSNKYMITSSGIYEMKYFFSSHVTSKNNTSDISSTKVKEIIKSIIESEGDDILSDEEISEELGKFNIQIARRTVAKYRESLGIETSSKRKRCLRSAIA